MSQRSLAHSVALLCLFWVTSFALCQACTKSDYLGLDAIVKKHVTVSGVYHYNGLDTARASNVEEGIIYIVQACDGATLKVYVGQTINSFKKRYSSNSAMSTGLKDVIDDVRDPHAGVDIYKVTSSLARTAAGYPDEVIANDVKKALPGSAALTNVRGISFKEVMGAGDGEGVSEVKTEGLVEKAGTVDVNAIKEFFIMKGKFYRMAVSCNKFDIQHKCLLHVNKNKEPCAWNAKENQCVSGRAKPLEPKKQF